LEKYLRPGKILSQEGGAVVGQAMAQHLPGKKIAHPGRNSGVGVSGAEENGNEFFTNRVSPGDIQEDLLVLPTPPETLLG
jgi:hypothetical protein